MRDYRARAAGERAVFTPAPRYRDYVTWLQRQPDLSDWWRSQLERRGTVAQLADALGSTSRREAGFGHRKQRLDDELTGRVRLASHRLQVTVHTLFQAAWAIVLARLAGQSCVAFGTTIAGRPEELAGIETAAGLFINSLPLHVDVSGAGSG